MNEEEAPLLKSPPIPADNNNNNASNENENGVAKRSWREVGSMVLLGVSAIACFVVIAMSFAAVSGNQDTNTGEQVFQYDNACTKSDVLNNNRPFRIYLPNDSRPIKCPWLSKNSGIRIILSVAGIIVCGLTTRFVYKRSSFLTWLGMFLLVICSFAFFYVMAIDANDVRKSSSWCKDKFQTAPWKSVPPSVICAYTLFGVTAVLDALLFVILIFDVVFMFFMMRHRGEQIRYRPEDTEPKVVEEQPTTYTNEPESVPDILQPTAVQTDKVVLEATKWAVENPNAARRVAHVSYDAMTDPTVQKTVTSIFGNT